MVVGFNYNLLLRSDFCTHNPNQNRRPYGKIRELFAVRYIFRGNPLTPKRMLINIHHLFMKMCKPEEHKSAPYGSVLVRLQIYFSVRPGNTNFAMVGHAGRI